MKMREDEVEKKSRETLRSEVEVKCGEEGRRRRRLGDLNDMTIGAITPAVNNRRVALYYSNLLTSWCIDPCAKTGGSYGPKERALKVGYGTEEVVGKGRSTRDWMRLEVRVLCWLFLGRYLGGSWGRLGGDASLSAGI